MSPGESYNIQVIVVKFVVKGGNERKIADNEKVNESLSRQLRRGFFTRSRRRDLNPWPAVYELTSAHSLRFASARCLAFAFIDLRNFSLIPVGFEFKIEVKEQHRWQPRCMRK